MNAIKTVNYLLDAKPLRVCIFCEKEFGPVSKEVGQYKTHSVCRRHLPEFIKFSAKNLPFEQQQQLLAKMMEYPDTYFAPDLSKQNDIN